MGTGATNSFSFPFVIQEAGQLEVTYVDADDVETVLSLGTGATNYSVTVDSYPGSGSITYPADESSFPTTSESLIIRRKVSLTQPTTLGVQGRYDPSVQEAVFDRLTMIDQQQQEELDRCVKAPITYDGTLADLIQALLDAADRAEAAQTAAETAQASAEAAAADFTFKGALAILTADEAFDGDVIIPWDDTAYDTDTFWSSGDPTKLTIPTGVTTQITKVRVGAGVRFNTGITDGSDMFYVIKKNALDAYSGSPAAVNSAAATTPGTTLWSPVIEVVAGDDFTFQVASGDTTGTIEADWTWFAIEVVEVSAV